MGGTFLRQHAAPGLRPPTGVKRITELWGLLASAVSSLVHGCLTCRRSMGGERAQKGGCPGA